MSLADGFFPISFLSDTASTGVLVIISGRIVNIRGEKGVAGGTAYQLYRHRNLLYKVSSLYGS